MQLNSDDLFFNAKGVQEKTLINSVSFTGVGMHNGKTVTMRIIPAPVSSGIVFKRVDLNDAIVPASYESVKLDRPFCTLIEGQNGACVSTIEHLMAALFAMQVDNAIIEIDSDEVPIMDGSSLPFYEAIRNVGCISQSAPKKILKILKDIRVETSWGYAEFSPLPYFSAECQMDFSGRHNMPSQRFIYRFPNINFAEEIAPARTYGFFEDVEGLQKAGFAKGGSLSNAVVVRDGVAMNPEGLRFADECVRHKVLDALGDLYLCGMLISGKYFAKNGGHALNNMLLKAVFADEKNYRIETLEPQNQNRSWEPFTRSMMAGWF